MKHFRLTLRALSGAFLLAATVSLFPFAAASQMLPERVIRLHVVASSDSSEDQAVKLKVRDAVLEEAARWYGDAGSMEEASAALCLHLGAIRDAAGRALTQNGETDSAAVQVTDLYFPTRDYEGFSLPAGKYRTLRVTIGEGKGKNWWCVVFPALCLPAAEDRTEDPLAYLSPEEQDLIEHPQEYRVKFKVVELYEALCRWLDGGD